MPMKNVDVKTLKGWLAEGYAVLVDVREVAEYQAESIKGAKLVPLSGVCCSSVPEVEGKKLVIQCQKGGRSAAACQKLISENPELEVYNLEGGITAWKDAGFDTESSGSFFLPLDRQVQLTIGLMLLAASVIGFFLTPLFFLLTGFFGLGLTIAGFTGFCGLARIMAKMPWNQKGKGKYEQHSCRTRC